MKGGQSQKTKVVVRHLPSTISHVAFLEQINVVFSGRYNWVSFRPGKSSQKHQSYSRAYIDFKKPEDVIEFAVFFNGHVFVNEKGIQFRAIVEYAPSQCVPKQRLKKDGREGTLSKDPAYLEFIKLISKPTENLPSAEMQLERREAEQAGVARDAPIITPLMDFVRKKRAAKNGFRRILSNGKISRRAGASGRSITSSCKRSSEKKRVSTKMYVLRETAKSTSGKDKSTYRLNPKRDDRQLFDKAATSTSASGADVLEDKSKFSGIADTGIKRIMLLKGKEKEASSNKESFENDATVSATKKSQQCEGTGRIIRSILYNKDSRKNQSSGVQSEQKIQLSNLKKEKCHLQPSHVQLALKDANAASDDKIVGNNLHGFSDEKQEKSTRKKDRPDRVVWAPLHRSDGSYAKDKSLSSSALQQTQSCVDSFPGSHKHLGRRGPSSHTVKDADVSSFEGKSSKRSGASVFGPHEKQVWVQKSCSGS